MSYSSRVYRQRNANSPDTLKKKAFFSGKDKQEKDHTSEKDPAQDPLEREADSVANSVVNEQSVNPGKEAQPINTVQKLATSKEEERASTNDQRMKDDKDVQEKAIQPMESEKKEDEVQKQQATKDDDKLKDEGLQKKDEGEPEKEEKESTTPVQPKRASTAEGLSQVRTKYLQDTKGKGSMLPKETLDEMNTKFGYDFKDVRIHDDSEAHKMSQEMNAQAFTFGNDIYFNEGKYNPTSTEGKLLLAHELTHVIQQRGQDQK